MVQCYTRSSSSLPPALSVGFLILRDHSQMLLTDEKHVLYEQDEHPYLARVKPIQPCGDSCSCNNCTPVKYVYGLLSSSFLRRVKSLSSKEMLMRNIDNWHW